MHERKKLKEAEYFYSRMVEEKENRDNVMYNLSAFLSSARSVLQYALKEVKTKPNGQEWYDNYISSNRVLIFFKDKRDINIHAEPIRPIVNYNLTIKDTVHISDSVSIILRDKNGNVKQQWSSAKCESKSGKPKTSSVLKIKYKFDDWTGSEDMLTLCKNYIQELENIINEGVRKEYITG